MVEDKKDKGRRSIRATALGASLMCPFAAYAQERVANGAEPAPIEIRRTAQPPIIDAVLDDAMWADAAVVDALHQINPVQYGEPSERTEVHLLYDDDALYIGVRLYDSDPERINARVLRQNQGLGSDDRFFVHIDPFDTGRGGYAFGVNPNGVRHDAVYESVTKRSFDWNGIWHAEARIDDQGWIAEIAIPFKTLSFDAANDTWRMNFTRNIERRNESNAWASRNRDTNLSTMGRVTGITAIEQGRGLDVVPSLTMHDRRDFATASDGGSDVEPSLDVFYRVTPSLTAALTLNTDFSATEVDDRQVNLSRFGLFFPERRDFFLQDAEIFRFGGLGRNGRPFFSRRIGIGAGGQAVPIDYGGKVSGRVGRWDIGALTVRQDTFGSVDSTTAIVGRVAANVLAESSVGAIMTKGDTASNLDNTVAGVDFRYVNNRLPGGRSVEGDFWYQQSDTPGLTGDDSAVGMEIRSPNNDGLRGSVGLMRIEENFNPALGFVNRAAIQDMELEFGHTWRPAAGALRTIFSGIEFNRIDYLDNGDVQSQEIEFTAVDLNFESQDEISIAYNENKEGLRAPFEIYPGVVLPAGTYTFGELDLAVRTSSSRVVGGGFFYQRGDFYSGERERLAGFVGWRPSRHFRTSIDYEYNTIELPEGAFVTRLVSLDLEAAFSSTLSWVNRIQYDNVSEIAGINSRLHWIPEAGREAFLVLNHNLEDFDRDDDFESLGSDVSVKFSYTFRF